MQLNELLLDVAATLEGLPLEELTDGEIADLGERLKALTIVQAAIKEQMDALTLAVQEQMPADEFPLQGTGVLRKSYRKHNRWKEGMTSKFQRDLATAIARLVAVDRLTGEVNADKRDAAIEAVETLVKTSGNVSNLTKDGQVLLDMDLEDYRDIGHTPTIKVDLRMEQDSE